MFDELREKVFRANIELQSSGLVILSWGNVSAIDRDAGVVIIKPSGIAYRELTPEKMVPVDLTGRVLQCDLIPSSDVAAHLELYRNFKSVGGICHTHSTNATVWAQAGKQIPCFGTTHADHFYGPVPVTKTMTTEEIKTDYELNTGKVIVRRFTDLDPLEIPACLVAHHGPFTWGNSADEAVKNAIALEEVAAMAIGTIQVNPRQKPISQALLDKHYLRKHGKNAYYGQKKEL